jgi:hypothetical protein
MRFSTAVKLFGTWFSWIGELMTATLYTRCTVLGSFLKRMAGTTGLEPAASAVTEVVSHVTD